jgi:GTP-binding protein HflX
MSDLAVDPTPTDDPAPRSDPAVVDVSVEQGEGGAGDGDESHRGAFGEFGGEAGGLIERTFRERIVVVGITLPGQTDEDTEASLDELALLVDTAGADVVDRVVQRRTAPDPATFIGKGKAAEVRAIADASDADTVVFDDELSPSQAANLTKLLGRTAIDRTAVILDIFAQNAHSQEGRAQVELALLRYRLPRLRGKGAALSQQTGAIGLRGGPGETQLEIDRRRIQRRIQRLERDLREVTHHRRLQRKARGRAALPSVAIVGYTNAGKSTLVNALTDAGVLVEDRLFATLDTTTRRLRLPRGEVALVVDTVGFIRKLPHQLVEAFKSTLEVVAEAELLVHLVDASAPDIDGNIAAVRATLQAIGAGEVAELLVFNKADQLAPGAVAPTARQPGSLLVSARTGWGLDVLVQTIADRLRRRSHLVDLLVPFDRGDLMAVAHRHGEVVTEEPAEEGMAMRVRLDDRGRALLESVVTDRAGADRAGADRAGADRSDGAGSVFVDEVAP